MKPSEIQAGKTRSNNAAVSAPEMPQTWWLGSLLRGAKLIPVQVLKETKTKVLIVDPYFERGTSWYEPKVCRSGGQEYQWIEPDRETVLAKLHGACIRECSDALAELRRKEAALAVCVSLHRGGMAS